MAKIEEQAATGPAEATTEIVTEAEKSVTAPLSSLRPPRQRPIVPAPTRTTKVLKPRKSGGCKHTRGVNDALREALADGKAEIPTGPPLSVGEKDALRVAVSNCWNVGSLSSESLQVAVVVAFDMSRDGRPVAPSIRLVSSSGGSASGAKQAYEAARRAIIRCAKNGYKLPLREVWSMERDRDNVCPPITSKGCASNDDQSAEYFIRVTGCNSLICPKWTIKD